MIRSITTARIAQRADFEIASDTKSIIHLLLSIDADRHLVGWDFRIERRLGQQRAGRDLRPIFEHLDA